MKQQKKKKNSLQEISIDKKPPKKLWKILRDLGDLYQMPLKTQQVDPTQPRFHTCNGTFSLHFSICMALDHMLLYLCNKDILYLC